MSKNEVYKHFLNDSKKETPDNLTKSFYESLQGVECDIVEYDKNMYRVRGNNNLIRLVNKDCKETENSIRYTKQKLKSNLYLFYVNIFGL